MDITKYSTDSLSQIENTNFLSKEDLNSIKELSTNLQKDFEKRQIFRTETEMKVSVLNDIKFPTKASKYWQSVRESSVFFENLVTLSFDYRRNEIEIRKLKKKIENEKDKDEKELLKIDLDECLFKKKNMEVNAKDRVREIKIWDNIKNELNDWSFNVEDVNEHQLISYTQRFINQSIVAWNNWSPAENQNLHWQLQSSLNECKVRWLFNKVISPYNEQIQKQLKNITS